MNSSQATITAEAKWEWEKKDGDRTLRSERDLGYIYRSFTLPVEFDEPGVRQARFYNCILDLKLVKKAAAPGNKLATQPTPASTRTELVLR